MSKRIAVAVAVVCLIHLCGCGGGGEESFRSVKTSAVNPCPGLDTGRTLIGGDEFSSMGDWGTWKAGQVSVAGGELFLRNRVASGPFCYQKSTIPDMGEVDIEMCVLSGNSDWGPDYGPPGGWIELGIGEVPDVTPADPWAECYAGKNAARPMTGLCFQMCFRALPSPSEDSAWTLETWENGVVTRPIPEFGPPFPDLARHHVLIEVRETRADVFVDGDPIGGADHGASLDGNKRLWLGATAGNTWTDYIRVYRHSEIVNASIDIKPGSDPNSINLGSKGIVPVAVLGDDCLAAADIDALTAVFEGAPPSHWAIDDVNCDGTDDMILHFRTQELSGLSADSTVGTLTGSTVAGQQFAGKDTIRIVSKARSNRGK